MFPILLHVILYYIYIYYYYIFDLVFFSFSNNILKTKLYLQHVSHSKKGFSGLFSLEDSVRGFLFGRISGGL